jgi:uncharacterized protein (TIGR04141 family)
MATKPRLTRLTVLLLKEGSSIDDALDSDRDIERHEVNLGSNVVARLAVGPTSSRTPAWVGYLRPHIAEPALDALRNASTAAVLLLNVENRIFALTFGYGRFLLDLDKLEHDFGLKVLVNTVAPDQLKSIDARSYDELTLHTRRDVSSESSLPAFEVDVNRDVVRSITGSPESEELARRMTGSDSLALNTRVQLPEVPDLCRELLKKYASEDYKTRFEFIDHLRRVTDKATVAHLDETLVDAIRAKDLDAMHLAPPETLDWVDIEGFRFSIHGSNEEPATDPAISAYLAAIDPETVDLDDLKRHRVLAIGAALGGPVRSWSIYKCVVFETKQGDAMYVLTGGEWFRVSASFFDQITAFADQLHELDIDLPQAVRGMKEDDYNVAAAAATGSLCLDRQFLTKSVPDRVELCDLLTSERQLIHVKKRGASSTLSHLFAQGVNSAEWLIQDPAFRDEARELIHGLDPGYAALIPEGPIDPTEWEVAFVVITRSTRDSPLTLPFFSLVTLRSAVRRLQALRFRVSAKSVSET